MSTIKATTLSTQSNATVPIDTVVNGTAKAWVNFNGTGTVAIRASFNVSSITDNGVGDYTVNFTTAMTDANYAFTTATEDTGGSPVICQNTSTAPTSAALRIVRKSSAGVSDVSLNYVAIFR